MPKVETSMIDKTALLMSLLKIPAYPINYVNQPHPYHIESIWSFAYLIAVTNLDNEFLKNPPSNCLA